MSERHAYLSTKPKDKSVGAKEKWDAATESLRKAILKEGLQYDIDEGGGAFYGPKIDLKVKDAIGREWQLSTVQFDFNLPERFHMTYVDKDGSEKQPYMRSTMISSSARLVARKDSMMPQASRVRDFPAVLPSENMWPI